MVTIRRERETRVSSSIWGVETRNVADFVKKAISFACVGDTMEGISPLWGS